MRSAAAFFALSFGLTTSGAFFSAACTYTAVGQGGDEGALAPYFAEDGSAGNGSSGGGSSGGGSGGGGSSGSSSGSSSGGSSSGVVPPSDDGGAPTPVCSPGTVPCGNGGCCTPSGADAGPPPPPGDGGVCAPPPNYPNDCQGFITDLDAGAACSSCVQSASKSCGFPSCANPCTQCMGQASGQCGCLKTCLQAQYGGSNEATCCLESLDSYFTCVESICSSAASGCPAPP